jgi:hypothetical protein
MMTTSLEESTTYFPLLPLEREVVRLLRSTLEPDMDSWMRKTEAERSGTDGTVIS